MGVDYKFIGFLVVCFFALIIQAVWLYNIVQFYAEFEIPVILLTLLLILIEKDEI